MVSSLIFTILIVSLGISPIVVTILQILASSPQNQVSYQVESYTNLCMFIMVILMDY